MGVLLHSRKEERLVKKISQYVQHTHSQTWLENGET